MAALTDSSSRSGTETRWRFRWKQSAAAKKRTRRSAGSSVRNVKKRRAAALRVQLAALGVALLSHGCADTETRSEEPGAQAFTDTTNDTQPPTDD